MKFKRLTLFIVGLTILVGCEESMEPKIKKDYELFFPNCSIDLLSHFPKNISKNFISSYMSSAFSMEKFNYCGVLLFVKYENAKEKEECFKNINLSLLDTIFVSREQMIFLSDIRHYCDSIDVEKSYKIYPFPNVQDYINDSNYDAVEQIKFSADWKDYKFYLIELKNEILFEEQKDSNCEFLQKELGHGYSRGIILNEKDKFLFYCLCFW